MTASRVEHLAEGVTLYLGDCREILPTLAPADAVVTDPPYGINEAAGKNASRGKLAVSKDYGNDDWDSKPIDAELMRLVRGSGRYNIIFGGNYYDSPAASCWLVWDKENGASDFADCELAWTNLPKAVRRIKFMWNGMLRANGEKRGDHPTQKPIGVMKWCIGHIPPPCAEYPRSVYGQRYDGCRRHQDGAPVHRHRARATIFRGGLSTHRRCAARARHVHRASGADQAGLAVLMSRLFPIWGEKT